MTTSESEFSAHYIRGVARILQSYKDLGDDVLRQTSEVGLHINIGTKNGTIAAIAQDVIQCLDDATGTLMVHLSEHSGVAIAGLWPTAERKSDANTNQSIYDPRGAWNKAWATALELLQMLQAADLDRHVLLRGELTPVVAVLSGVSAKVAYQVGQIVLLADHLARTTAQHGPSKRTECIE
jgi:hypothetical protein